MLSLTNAVRLRMTCIPPCTSVSFVVNDSGYSCQAVKGGWLTRFHSLRTWGRPTLSPVRGEGWEPRGLGWKPGFGLNGAVTEPKKRIVSEATEPRKRTISEEAPPAREHPFWGLYHTLSSPILGPKNPLTHCPASP